jgi:prepilin-type N-terminal cleavage/methylation domain-containing protein
MKNRTQGFGLVEIVVAIAIFSIVMAAVSSSLISNMQLRQRNQKSLAAQQYALEALEIHKNHWSIVDNYRGRTTSTPFTAPSAPNLVAFDNRRPGYVQTPTYSYSCLSSAGTMLPLTTNSLNCSVSNPDLRRVTVVITDLNNTVLARLTTEIGRPFK